MYAVLHTFPSDVLEKLGNRQPCGTLVSGLVHCAAPHQATATSKLHTVSVSGGCLIIRRLSTLHRRCTNDVSQCVSCDCGFIVNNNVYPPTECILDDSNHNPCPALCPDGAPAATGPGLLQTVMDWHHYTVRPDTCNLRSVCFHKCVFSLAQVR